MFDTETTNPPELATTVPPPAEKELTTAEPLEEMEAVTDPPEREEYIFNEVKLAEGAEK